MEMLEAAGRNYLNQPFSDDASSHDGSPPSELITFTVSPDYSHQQHKEVARRLRASELRRSSEPVSPGRDQKSRRQRQQVARTGTTQGDSEKRTISPHATHSTPAAGRSVRREQKSRASPKPSRRGGASSPKVFESGGGQGQVQQATSYDGSKRPPRNGRKGSKGSNGSLPNSRSTSPFSTSPQDTSNPGGGTNWNPTPVAAAPSGFSPSIARKLFSPERLEDEATTPTATCAASLTTPSTLETLFSQVSAHGLSSSVGAATSNASSSKGPLPLQAISLAEIESQLKAEVPSPDAANLSETFILLSKDSSREGSAQEAKQVLLQPSAFSVATSGSSSSSESVSPPCSGRHTVTSTARPHPVGITVEPPTPVASHSQGLLFMATPTAPGPGLSHSHIVTSPPTNPFPPIPPLMHSPGMKAAPIATQASQPTRSKTAPLLSTLTSHGGRQPVTTATTAQSAHPVSTGVSQEVAGLQTTVSVERSGHHAAPVPAMPQAATAPLQMISVIPSRAVTVSICIYIDCLIVCLFVSVYVFDMEALMSVHSRRTFMCLS